MTTDALRDATAIAAALDDARAQAEDGALIDLAGLEERVGALCATLTDADRADADRADAGKALARLLGSLDALAATLERQRETAAAVAEGRPDPHSARRAAATAYARGGDAGAHFDPSPAPPPNPSPNPSPEESS